MTKYNPSKDHTSVKRRRMLKTLGVGSLAFGMIGGSASAENGTKYSIVGSESLSDSEASDQLSVALDNEAVQNYTSEMESQGLARVTGEVQGVRLQTDDDAVNARNPNLIQIPYSASDGESVLHVGLIDDDSGARTSWPEYGTFLNAASGDTVSRYYLFDQVNPYVQREELLPVTYPLCVSLWPCGWGPCYPVYYYWANGRLHVCEWCWDYVWYYLDRYWPWRIDWYWDCHPVYC